MELFAGMLPYFIDPRFVLLCFVGAAAGLFVGAIPGLSVSMATALLVSLTYTWETTDALAMIMGVYVVGVFSGAISAILINIPGAPSSVVTTLDGYPLARRGEAYKALLYAAVYSFVGSVFGLLALGLLARPVTALALRFQPMDYFLLSLFGLATVGGLSTGNYAKGLVSALLGVFLALIGLDSVVGTPRLTFGVAPLMAGIPTVPALVGLFGLAEVLSAVADGAADGALGASDMLKPMLARGELQTIGATTTDEYRKYIEKDAALERRFQPIQVHEPTIAETIEILKGLRERYENHHRVTITDSAIQAAAELSSRYIQDRRLPDKAIDLIDEAGARLRIKRLTTPPELKELEAKVAKVSAEKEQAVKDQDFEKAAAMRDDLESLQNELKDKETAWHEGGSDVKMVVDEDVIAEVVSSTTGIPVVKLTQAESKKLLNMEAELHKRIIGQDEAVSALSRSIRRTRVGLKDPKRPSGSFIFAGPTGVGKTELAKTLAEFLFDDEDALIRVDMSEFSEKYAASRLFGAPPGYVGYEEGGELTEKVRRKPFSVVLFDEIEKAHPDIFNTLLQVLDDGHLTDGQGRKVDFKNTIIILTTNLGARDIAKAANTGFSLGTNSESSYQRMKEQVSSELKQQFRPEFLNRLDDIIVFKQLTEPEVRQIVDLDVKQLNDRLFDRHMELDLTDKAKDLLAQKGFDPLLGARPLRRVIQRDIEDAISEKILMGELTDGERVKVDAEGEGVLGDFIFTSEAFDAGEGDSAGAESGSAGAGAESGSAGAGSADSTAPETPAAPDAPGSLSE